MATRDIRAARRYAIALFETARKQEILATVEADMTKVLTLMTSVPALKQMWESPLIPSGRKRELIKTTLGSEISDLTLSFLRLLVDKRREDLLEPIDTELRREADASRHLLRAEATFAIEPTTQEKKELQTSLEKRTGENVELSVKINPDILGGVIVQMQDTVLDGSVRGSLERMRERLLQEI